MSTTKTIDPALWAERVALIAEIKAARDRGDEAEAVRLRSGLAEIWERMARRQA